MRKRVSSSRDSPWNGATSRQRNRNPAQFHHRQPAGHSGLAVPGARQDFLPDQSRMGQVHPLVRRRRGAGSIFVRASRRYLRIRREPLEQPGHLAAARTSEARLPVHFEKGMGTTPALWLGDAGRRYDLPRSRKLAQRPQKHHPSGGHDSRGAFDRAVSGRIAVQYRRASGIQTRSYSPGSSSQGSARADRHQRCVFPDAAWEILDLARQGDRRRWEANRDLVLHDRRPTFPCRQCSAADSLDARRG